MIFEGPINNLSIGNVSFNFLKELYNRKVETLTNCFFPIANNLDLSAFEVDENLRNWIARKSLNPFERLKWEDSTLKCWHINGSEKRLTENQYLYTFYEVDSPTKEEIAIVNNQTHTFFSSSESAAYFRREGCENVSFVPLGFDESFKLSEPSKKLDCIHFGLIGKLERRKNTQRIIKLWLERFGNDRRYQLTCLINNPFFPQDFYQKVIRETLGDKNWFNVNFLNPLQTNREVAELQNSIDIDLSGISNGEGWGLPAFNATCLGKWSIVSDCSGHKDWANKDNSILIPVFDKQPCYDGVFFREGDKTNQGSYYLIKDEEIMKGFEKALEKYNATNKEGIALGERLTYKNSMDKILNIMGE